MGKEWTKEEVASRIDHTILKADARTETVRQYCDEAKRYHFHSVCVNGCRVSFAAGELEGTGITVCCVVGFPLGAMSTEAKAFEAKTAVRDGAGEIDMVMNIGALKDGDTEYVRNDIASVVRASAPAAVKVIIETCLLDDAEKAEACRLAEEAGAAFVKTSTGFSTGGATAEDVMLMKKTVGDRMKIKASGGIRTPESARRLLDAGADRLGVSHGTECL